LYTENIEKGHLFHKFITDFIIQYYIHYVCHLLWQTIQCTIYVNVIPKIFLMMVMNKVSWIGQAECKHYYSMAKFNRWSFILTVNYLHIWYL